MDRRSSRLIVEPTSHQGLVVFFDGIKLIGEGSMLRWELGGVCFRSGAHLEALELRNDDIVVPSISTLALPSPGIAADNPTSPESGYARCRISFDATAAQQYPWLQLYAHFTGVEGTQVALIHLVENESISVSVPFIATVSHDKDRFRFYVANAGDEIQGRHHANGLLYETALLEYIRDTCPRGIMVADVGANVGNHAVYFDRVLGAREVVVFEPNEAASAILLKNIALNKCQNINTRYVKFGVSDTQGTYRLGMAQLNNLGGTPLVADSEGPITTVRLDDVLGSFRVGLIKIDVEGMEMSALRSGERLIARAAPIIAIEVTPASVSEVRTFLDACGYRIERTFSMYVDIATLIAVPTAIFPGQQ